MWDICSKRYLSLAQTNAQNIDRNEIFEKEKDDQKSIQAILY